MADQLNIDLFRQRAHAEAARYGSDPWVFVRELLQNARDAGAGRVEIEVARRARHESLTFRDDGRGMSYQHARRFLFALYASSKEHSREQAGKFGIGFWSVLRFAPSTITIRSCGSGAKGDPRGGAWQVSLDGELRTVEEVKAGARAMPRKGTEIVLERPAGDLPPAPGADDGEDLAAKVMAATRHYGRFLTRRDDPEAPLPITVNGRSANAEFELPAPCATFRGKGFRGVVGLGEEPEVELFAQGLFVRSASSLQDLRAAGDLAAEASDTTEDVLAELPSLAPRVLIDSAELDLLLARSDARYDQHMRRILGAAEKQLGRLITRQLQALRPQPFYRLWLGALRDRLEPFLGWHLAAAALAGLILGLVVLWWLPPAWLGFGEAISRASPDGAEFGEAATEMVNPGAAMAEAEARPPATGRSAFSADGGTARLSGKPGVAAASEQPFHSYYDLAERYHGPRPGGLVGDTSRLAMIYQPAGASPFFAALIIDRLTGSRWSSSSVADEMPPYEGVSCRQDCLEVELLVAEGQSALRLPMPSGHRLDSSSVRLDGRSREVYETTNGEALLLLSNGPGGVLEYRTGPASSLPSPPAVPRPPIDAPAELISIAGEIRRLPVAERPQRALDYVADRIVYDRSPAAGQHYRSPGSGPERLTGGGRAGLVEIALAVGAGDCDVQSGVLVTLLRLVGIDARLALGYAGIGGLVAPGLHAWVEYRNPAGAWSVADASVTPGDVADGHQSPARLPAAMGYGNVLFPSRSGLGSSIHPALPLAVVVLLLGAAWSLRRRSAASIELSASEDLAALLGGALRHPRAFAGLPAMFHGRFVPLIGRRGAISLARARHMAGKNRLFRSGIGSQLACRAAAHRASVIDASMAEGRVLSLALGAIDIDYWSSLLERGARPRPERDRHIGRLIRRINRRLDELSAVFRLGEVPDLPQPWVEVALDDLGLGKRRILIDPSHLEYAPVHALLSDHPQTAAFTMLDVLLHHVELAERERDRLLAVFARHAVLEAASSRRASSRRTSPRSSGRVTEP